MSPSSSKFRSSVAMEERDSQRDPPSGLKPESEECHKEGRRWRRPEDSIFLVEGDESGGKEEVHVEKDDKNAK